MQRTDYIYINGCRFFEQCLYLCAVFSDDAEVIATGFASPILVRIKCPEFAESVGREEYLVGAVICYYDFGPVNHGCGQKGQCVTAERKSIALADDHTVVGKVSAEEVFHHVKCLGRRNYASGRIDLYEICDVCRVVGLHMLNDKIVRSTSSEFILEVVQPFVSESGIYGVHNGDLFVHYDI